MWVFIHYLMQLQGACFHLGAPGLLNSSCFGFGWAGRWVLVRLGGELPGDCFMVMMASF